ncbi:MAG: glycosyltransferase [Candidatus Margulisiibacteriota bacterium]
MDKIAFAVHKYLGLSETFIYEPLRNIKAFEAIVLTLAKENLDKFPHPKIYSISDLPLQERLLENLTNYFGRFAYFKKIIKDLNIKLIHAHFAWEGIFILSLKRHFNLPLITSLYGQDIYRYPRDPVYRWQLKRLFSEGDLFLAACKDLKNKAISLGCPKNKIIVHHCRIDLNNFTPIKTKKEKTKIKILMCGRLVEKKGFAYGIKAFAQSFNKYRNIRLQIIGDGPLKNKLISLIKKMKLEEFISLQGSKSHPEIARAMRDADIFMMSYVTAKNGDSEAAPLVLKEAQATGLPAISTRHAGVPEIVLDGKTGFLVEEKDVKGLAQKLNNLIENPQLRAKFGERGRRLIEERFNIKDQTCELEDIYKELIPPCST